MLRSSAPTGHTGPSGPNATLLVTGATGESIPGPTGPSGVNASAGPTGPIGTANVTGATGPAGESPTGPTGPTGTANVTGATGLQGVAYAWSALCRYNSTALSIPTATDTLITFDTQLRTAGTPGITYAGGVFTNTSGSSKIWTISYRMSFGGNTTGSRYTWISHSATSTRLGLDVIISNTSLAVYITGTATLVVGNNETVSLYAYQDSGSTLVTISNFISPAITIRC